MRYKKRQSHVFFRHIEHAERTSFAENASEVLTLEAFFYPGRVHGGMNRLPECQLAKFALLALVPGVGIDLTTDELEALFAL